MAYRDKEKQRAMWRAWYHRNKAKKSATQKRMHANLRAWFAALKSTKSCELCGESDPVCLNFHHKTGQKKVAAIADGIRKAWSQERVLAEIEKCVVLCANCHAKEHWNERLAKAEAKSRPARLRAPSQFES